MDNALSGYNKQEFQILFGYSPEETVHDYLRDGHGLILVINNFIVNLSLTTDILVGRVDIHDVILINLVLESEVNAAENRNEWSDL